MNMSAPTLGAVVPLWWLHDAMGTRTRGMGNYTVWGEGFGDRKIEEITSMPI
jgi:hypothetical protein